MADPTSEELKKRFDWMGIFQEGLAAVEKDGKQYHIRRNGNAAYTKRFDWVGLFNNGSAEVRDGGQFHRIRPDGTRLASR